MPVAFFTTFYVTPVDFRDLLKQAQMLIDRLGQHSQYKDAWKVVTIFIGANDVCGCDKGDVSEYTWFFLDSFDS